MSKFDEALAKYTTALGDQNVAVDADLLSAVTKGLGPSIYNRDASLVSCSDKEELARVKKNFLQGKMGLTDDAKSDAAIEAVCKAYDSRTKYRAVFYYMLVKELGLESKY